MFERVFLSYNYERDSARAAAVAGRPSPGNRSEFSGVIDANEWRHLERLGSPALKNWIDSRLAATTVTAVLITGETEKSPFVHYEIQQARARGHGLIGIHVHRIPHPRTGLCDYKGRNPLEVNFVAGSAPPVPLSDLYPVYDWVVDDGRLHLEAWLQEAGQRARGQRSGPVKRLPTGPSGQRHGTLPTFRHVGENWPPDEFIAER